MIVNGKNIYAIYSIYYVIIKIITKKKTKLYPLDSYFNISYNRCDKIGCPCACVIVCVSVC